MRAPQRLSRDPRGVVHIGHPVIGTICHEDEGPDDPGPPTCLWCVAGNTPKLFDDAGFANYCAEVPLRAHGQTSLANCHKDKRRSG